MNISDVYQPNSHYFANCGPSIVKFCLSRKNANRRTKTELTTEGLSVSANIKDSNELDSQNQNQIVKPTLEFSNPVIVLNRPENNIKFSNIKKETNQPTQKPETLPTKLRNLSPATLSQMLTAELDHFLKVEQNIAQIAEVETNVEAAKHEHFMANQIEFEDDTEELKELQKLDAEIARLEAIYQQKLNEQSYSYYSYSEIQSTID